MFSTSEPVRLGVIGLGRAFALTAPAISAHPGVHVVAGADPHLGHRQNFEKAFDATGYPEVSGVIDHPDVEAVYIATPHGLHREHAEAAINAGKHVLVEKPLTVDIGDATALVEAAASAGVHLIVGPSHSFDGPVQLGHEVVSAGKIGRVRMIHALYATDFLYRPRTPAELDTSQGGGVVFSQAIHQIDVVRRLMPSHATQVYARTGGAWDPGRPTEGAYSMLIDFADDAYAALTYSGYAHFDGDRLMEDISELGTSKDVKHRNSRKMLSEVQDELALKTSRGFTSLADCPQAITHEHFGQLLVFGDQGDLRLTPRGVEVDRNDTRAFYSAPFRTSRAEVFDTLHAAVRNNAKPLQNGFWGRASLEICHALLASAKSKKPVPLKLQLQDPR